MDDQAMTPPIRVRCIQAAAEAIDEMAAEDGVNWNPNMARVFDAILGVLTQSADEWAVAAEPSDDPGMIAVRRTSAKRLLVALEGET